MNLKQGELIALYRTRRGWTQKMLGEKLFPGLSAPHVKMRKIEAGLQKPTPEELKAIGIELGIDFENVEAPHNGDFIVTIFNQKIYFVTPCDNHFIILLKKLS